MNKSEIIINKINVRPVRLDERSKWTSICKTHHYLGFKGKFGHQIYYCVEYKGQWIGIVGWASAFLSVQCRDGLIGWNRLTKPKKIEQIANNFRFLILPGYNIKNLASKIISLNLKRLRSDWKKKFDIDLLMVETFVNPLKFSGTIYKASSWTYIGQTKGFSFTKTGWRRNSEPKNVFIKFLTRTSLKHLSDTSIKMYKKESRLVHIYSSAIEGKGGLIDMLNRINDPRNRQGRRFPFCAIMGLVTCAMLSGADSFVAIHEWLKKQKKSHLLKLRCRKGTPPGLTTIKDLVYKIDAEEFDKNINNWLTTQENQNDSNAVAIKGKMQRGSKKLAENKKPVHLLSALLHHEKLISQTKIGSNTTKGVAL